MNCKRITYQIDPRILTPTVLLGLIEAEDQHFIYFKTRAKKYQVARTAILAIEDTNTKYVEDNQEKEQ